MKRLIHILLPLYAFAGFLLPTQAQQIWVEPEFPLAGLPATVYFDAKSCDCPMSGYNGSVYAHTGVLKSGSVWQNVIGTWGDNSTQPVLRPLGNQVYALDISPSIAEFYSDPDPASITRMAFVFRSSDGTQQTADLFVDVFQTGESRIVSPQADQVFSPDDTVRVEVVALGADSITLFLNGDQLNTAQGGQLNLPIPDPQAGLNELLVQVAVDGRVEPLYQVFYVTRSKNELIAPIPAEFEHYGVNPIPGENAALFVLPAPGKSFAFITGDFSDWGIREDLQMNVSIDQKVFWVRVEDLDPDTEYGYQYILDGGVQIADPYARKVLDPWNDPYITEEVYPGLKPYPVNKTTDLVSTFRLAEKPFEWKATGYSPPRAEDLQIYELLVRDFVRDHRYASVMDSLDYLQSIGINAIELMPVMEFEGNSSWGYNTSFHFALDKYYGTPTDLKNFIDVCHERGIAVILDLVINHAYGQNPMVRMYWDNQKSRPAEDNPWFNTVSPNQVFSFGYDFNHESTYTVDYFNEVLTYWLEEYRVDGYRLDFTKGLTNRPGDGSAYDASRIRILKNYADHVWSLFPGAYMILEHFAPTSEEQELTDHGMLVWGNQNHNFNQIAMGYLSGSNFSWASDRTRDMDEPRIVTYMESHDEERMMFKTGMWGNQSGEYDIKILETGIERAKLASALWLSVPGPKLMWMFGELGYDVSIDNPCRVCEKPIRWNYLDDPLRQGLKTHYADLLRLRSEEEVFHTRDFAVSGGRYVKWVYLKGSENQVLTLANTDVVSQRADIPVEGDMLWTDFFTGRQVTSKGGMISIDLAPGEYMLLSITPFRQLIAPVSGITMTANLNPGYTVIQSALPLKRVALIDLNGRVVYELNDIGQKVLALDLQTKGFSGLYVLWCQDENGYKDSFKWVIAP